MTDETTAVAAAETPAEVPVPAAVEPVSAPLPPKRAKSGNTVYLAVIAVLATLLLIVAGLMLMGRLVFLPAGARFGRPGSTNGSGFFMQRTIDGPPDAEHLRRMEQDGAKIQQMPDGGVMVTK